MNQKDSEGVRRNPKGSHLAPERPGRPRGSARGTPHKSSSVGNTSTPSTSYHGSGGEPKDALREERESKAHRREQREVAGLGRGLRVY